MSTSFLVIQAQRDLAQAKTNALGAVLAYDLALVDFESLQEAGPASGSAPGATPSVTAAAVPSVTSGLGINTPAPAPRPTTIPGLPQQ